MVLSRRQACRQKKQIEGCSKNTWNATKILKIQCALQRVILRCLDQSGHMGTFYSGVLRIDIQGGAVSGCCMRSAWKLQGSLASGPPCQPVPLHHDYLRSRSRALGWQSAQKGIAGASRVASASTPNSWRPGFASALYAIARWHALVCRCWLVGRSVPCACVRV